MLTENKIIEKIEFKVGHNDNHHLTITYANIISRDDNELFRERSQIAFNLDYLPTHIAPDFAEKTKELINLIKQIG